MTERKKNQESSHTEKTHMARGSRMELQKLREVVGRIADLINEVGPLDPGSPMVSTPPPVAVSIEQAAALLNVAPSTLDEYMRSRQLEYFRMGRRKLIRLEALEEFAKRLAKTQGKADDFA